MAAESLERWQVAMWGLEDEARGLSAALVHMKANTDAAEAGDTQTRLTERWPKWMDEIAADGKRIIEEWNPRLEDQASGLAAAGGVDEVYGRKEAATPARIPN
jgi:hypothetical protein